MDIEAKYAAALTCVRVGKGLAEAAELHGVDQAVLACMADNERRMRKGVEILINGQTPATILKRRGDNVQVHTVDGVCYWAHVANCKLAK